MIILFMIVASPSFSQIRVHRSYNVDEGLVQSQVLTLTEDNHGFIWIGTAGGVSKWDGVSFENYTMDDGLISSQVDDIIQGKDGRIYFSSYGGVSVYHNGKITPFIDLRGEKTTIRIMRLYQNFENDLFYLGSSAGNVFIYKDSVLVKTVELKRADGKLSRSTRTGQIFKSRSGSVVVATNNGIFKFNGLEEEVNDSLETVISSGNAVNDIFEDHDGKIYYSTTKGVFIRNGDHIEKHIFQNKIIRNITRNFEGKLVIGTEDGIIIYKNETDFFEITDKNGLGSNIIYAILSASTGITVIGTDGGGISIYESDRFITYDKNTGLLNDGVSSVFEDNDGRLFLGAHSGFSIINQDMTIAQYSLQNGLPDNQVRTINQDHNGNIMLGLRKGLALMDKNGRFKMVPISVEKSAPQSLVTLSILKDDTKYYIMTNRGVFNYSDHKLQYYDNVQDSLRAYTLCGIKSSDDTLYFGTYTGVFVYYNNQFVRSFKFDADKPSNTIYSICEGRDKTLYFGTRESGMFYLKNGKWNRLDKTNGLSANDVNGIIEDDHGRIYAATSRGITVLDFSSEKPLIKYLNKSDGLTSDETNLGPFYKLRDGRLVFGTIKGVSVYNPYLKTPPTLKPNIMITSLDISERQINTGAEKNNIFQFNYDENFIKLNFVALKALHPEKNTYYYKLSGVNEDWVNSRNKYADYTKLIPGNYKFEVYARDEFGNESDVQSLSFIITPPWWKTNLFIYSLSLLVVIIILTIIYQWFHHLISIERLRTKISADFHDNVGAGLTEIYYLSEIGKLDIKNQLYGNALTAFESINLKSMALTNSASDIVWLINPKQDTLSDLFAKLHDSYEELMARMGIRFHIKDADHLMKFKLKMEYRQHLYLIFKEAINNSLKHSGCSELLIDIIVIGKSVSIRLKDNGKGIVAPARSSQGNGLNNMRLRAKKIGAEFFLTSEADSGTTIEVKVSF